jgi:hypothetical protein
MKTILCDEDQLPEEHLHPGYFFSARMAQLQNISERISVSSMEKNKSVQFETILKPQDSILTKYKTILNSNPTPEPLKPQSDQKPSPKAQAKTSKGIPNKKKLIKTNKSNNFVKENIKEIKNSSKVYLKSSLKKDSPKDKVKVYKNVTIADNNQINLGLKRPDRYNPELLSLVFKQFTDLVLLQWEEAADMLIDEILEEEVRHLNSLNHDENPEDSSPALKVESAEDLLLEFERIQEFQAKMKNKYKIH